MVRKLTDTFDTNYKVIMYQGIAWYKHFTYTNADDTPIDLTGKIVSIKFKDVFPEFLELFSDTGNSALGSNIMFEDASLGKFIVSISKEETETAECGNGKWWVEYYESSDSERNFGRLIAGPFDVIVNTI